MARPLERLLDGPRERAAEPVQYCMAGHGLRVHYADPLLRAAFSPALDHLRGPVDGQEELDLFVTVGGAGPLEGAAAGVVRPRVHFSTGPLRGVQYPASGICGLIDTERGRAVWSVPDPARIPISERSGPFRTVLQWWLAGHDLQIAHAGAVGLEDGAALLVGRGGAGKSVTSVACATAGLFFLGDDSVLVGVDPLPRAHCLYGTATVSREDAGRFTDLPAAASTEAKVLLNLTRRVARSLPLTALLVPEITGRPASRLTSLSAADAFRAMAPSSLFNLPGSGEETVRRLARLARRVPAYRLALGTDLRQVAEIVAGLLDRRAPR